MFDPATRFLYGNVWYDLTWQMMLGVIMCITLIPMQKTKVASFHKGIEFALKTILCYVYSCLQSKWWMNCELLKCIVSGTLPSLTVKKKSEGWRDPNLKYLYSWMELKATDMQSLPCQSNYTSHFHCFSQGDTRQLVIHVLTLMKRIWHQNLVAIAVLKIWK